jgi:hypothetical protein
MPFHLHLPDADLCCLQALWVGHVEPEDKLSRDLDSIYLGLEPEADDPDYSTLAALSFARSPDSLSLCISLAMNPLH